MSLQKAAYPTFSIQEPKSELLDVKSILNKYLYHWPLFIIGIALTVAGAFIYLQLHHQPLYQIKATLVFKDEKDNPNQKSALQEIDLLNSTKIIENEIEILKSNRLISQVVQDLQLWISYQTKDGFISSQDLYQTSPVKITLLNPTGNFEHAVIKLIVKDKNSLYLILPNGKLRKLYFKDTFQNSFGSWMIQPTTKLLQYKGATIQVTLKNPATVAAEYQKAIDASLPNKLSTAVVLSLFDQVPERGKDILNRLILNYNLADKSEQNRETKKTLDFLDQRLFSLTGELTDAEKGIEGFKSSRGLTDISSESNIALQNMQGNDSRLNEVNIQLNVIDGIEKYINSPQNTGKAPATLGVSDAALNSLVEKLAQLQLQHVQLLTTTPETNPDFEAINKQIATTRTAIKETVKNIKTSLLGTREKLQSYNVRFESSIKNIPTQERQYISIKRQQSSKENLYTYLLQKREEASVNYASTVAHDRVVDQAYFEPVPGQKPALIFAIAVLAGICLPVGLIYGRNNLNGRITDVQEIKDLLDIPVIGELPLGKSTDKIAVDDQNSNATTEQFRALRTKLHFLFENNERGRVTLLTSSVPGEGKSFVSSNLAIALAYTGRKTIILELDLRKPRIAEIFNLPRTYSGISDFLTGKADQNAIIQNAGLSPNLDIICSGSIISNPSELLEQKQLKELILNLRNKYDDIIIDSPPVRLVPDAMILSRITDITLYIIRQGFTQKSELKFIKELHDQKQLSKINLIFNSIQRAKYGYGYNYNHGYYNPGQKQNNTSVFSDFFNRF